MGVVQISQDPSDIWGVASRLIYDIIVFAADKVGTKEYLTKFRNQFDWGYNTIELHELNANELEEFRNLTVAYLDSRAYENLGFDSSSVADSLVDFLSRVDHLIASREGLR